MKAMFEIESLLALLAAMAICALTIQTLAEEAKAYAAHYKEQGDIERLVLASEYAIKACSKTVDIKGERFVLFGELKDDICPYVVASAFRVGPPPSRICITRLVTIQGKVKKLTFCAKG